jgi:hypothetical protein
LHFELRRAGRKIQGVTIIYKNQPMKIAVGVEDPVRVGDNPFCDLSGKFHLWHAFTHFFYEGREEAANGALSVTAVTKSRSDQTPREKEFIRRQLQFALSKSRPDAAALASWKGADVK